MVEFGGVESRILRTTRNVRNVGVVAGRRRVQANVRIHRKGGDDSSEYLYRYPKYLYTYLPYSFTDLVVYFSYFIAYSVGLSLTYSVTG